MRNISIRTLLLFTFLSLCLYPLSACESNTSTKEAAAVEAADKWLALVDNSQYTESWSEAADYFKNVIDNAVMCCVIHKKVNKSRARHFNFFNML